MIQPLDHPSLEASCDDEIVIFLQICEQLSKPMVNSALEGFNGTLMAYGQTGTGKIQNMGNFLCLSNLIKSLAQTFYHSLFQRNRWKNFHPLSILVGKTHTLMAPDGITHDIINKVFERTHSDVNHEFKVK